MKTTLVAFVLAGATATAPPPVAARSDLIWFGARLSGAFVPSGGDSDGVGSLLMEVDTARNRVCYTLMARNIGLSRAAKLHLGTGVWRDPAAIVLDVTGPRNTTCAPVSPELVEQMITGPQQFYVTVNNRQFPGGALRGQLRKR